MTLKYSPDLASIIVNFLQVEIRNCAESASRIQKICNEVLSSFHPQTSPTKIETNNLTRVGNATCSDSIEISDLIINLQELDLLTQSLECLASLARNAENLPPSSNAKNCEIALELTRGIGLEAMKMRLMDFLGTPPS